VSQALGNSAMLWLKCKIKRQVPIAYKLATIKKNTNDLLLFQMTSYEHVTNCSFPRFFCLLLWL